MPPKAHVFSSFPRAILHIDGDAFFASCEQARNPALKGKPVITGKERGIAASMSYEAKARGVTRAMRLFEILKLCPDAIILPSDYETYSLLSKRLYDIVRRYTSAVEEYGIDECFADLTGLRRPLHLSYRQIAERIQKDLATELGFTFSIGLASTKVLAKMGSKWKKPDGLTVISNRDRERYLASLPVEKVWGIGPQTSALLYKFNIITALQFAERDETWVQKWLSKPFYEIWQELNGSSVMDLVLEERAYHYSIQKMKTFTPPSSDKRFVFAQLSKNVENACIRARRYKQAAKEVTIVLRTQDFHHRGIVVTLTRPSNRPNEMIAVLETAFDQICKANVLYRMTGVVLTDLRTDSTSQLDLFGESTRAENLSRVYERVDELAKQFGKHTVFLGSSWEAHKFGAHLGNRGDEPNRKADLFKGETKRRRLGIPMFSGQVY